MMKTVFLHIGTDKTGSTAIQESLKHLQQEMAAHNISFLSSPGHNHAHLDKAAKEGDFEKVNALLDEIRSSDIENHVISFEGLYHLGGDKLKDFLRCFSDFYLNVFIYVRRREDKIRSGLAQRLKFRPGAPGYDFIDKVYSEDDVLKIFGKGGEFDYYSIVKKWDIAISEMKIAGKVNVLPYDKSIMVGGSVVVDFLKNIGLREDDAKRLLDKYTENASRNPFPNSSISPAAQDMMALCFLLVNDKSLYKFIYSIVEENDNKSKSKASRIKDKDIELYGNRFRYNDEKLYQEYFPGEAGFISEPQFYHEDPDAHDFQLLAKKILSESKKIRSFSSRSPLDSYVEKLKKASSSLEKVDLDSAIKMLELALEIRPNGPVLKKRLGRLKELKSEGKE